MDNYEFAQRIVELRRQKGLSQKQLGEMLGVSNKAVSKWENGESMPKMSTMLSLAEILGIDGNELIGYESAVQDNADSEEIERLKGENAELSLKLDMINKKKKRSFFVAVALCIVGIIACAAVAICFGIGDSTNTNVKDAGAVGTKIEFADKTFVTPSDFQQLIVKQEKQAYYFDSDLLDKKYAEYYDKSGNSQTVIVGCNPELNVVMLTVGKKEYTYINSSLDKGIIDEKNVRSISLYFEDDSFSDINSLREQEFDRDYFMGREFIKAFCKFYADKGEPVDSRIVMHYAGQRALTVKAYFDYDRVYLGDISLGEFFVDDKNNVYFYDYATASAYSVGKELSGYVIEK
ncbi:helix-turn-helix domain-containing protein [uncultured Eubacterium sp.]|uniref:helix-turn-helix domain-containing protein n=1 Tax=uncultured Eubacterium sp. TaxID=165185 RepID=UPI0015B7AC9A|nr:helix-turn-helix domain-containing protein [uncultured Eubacterium sp.]